MKFFAEHIQEAEVKSFLTLPNEKLLFATRKHKATILVPLSILYLLLLVGEVILASALVLFLISWFVWIMGSLLIISLGISFTVKMIVDWYSHFYMVTNRKIMEVNSAPLFSHTSDNVFLDQVRVTEINVAVNSFVQELIKIGDVTVTFDKQYQDEEFKLCDIPNPQEAGTILGNGLEMIMYESPAWFAPRSFSKTIKFAGDLYGKGAKI